MRDLMCKKLPPINWAVRDLIAEGLAVLAAKAKKDKSTLALDTDVMRHDAMRLGGPSELLAVRLCASH